MSLRQLRLSDLQVNSCGKKASMKILRFVPSWSTGTEELCGRSAQRIARAVEINAKPVAVNTMSMARMFLLKARGGITAILNGMSYRSKQTGWMKIDSLRYRGPNPDSPLGFSAPVLQEGARQ